MLVKLSIPIPAKKNSRTGKISLNGRVSLNQIYSGIHFSKRNNLKNLWLASVQKIVKKERVTKYPVKIRMVFYQGGKLYDSSNCAFMGKMIEDALVKTKVLKDDTPKYVSEVTYVSKKGTPERVDVFIE